MERNLERAEGGRDRAPPASEGLCIGAPKEQGPLSENQDFIPNLIAVLASPRNMTSNKSIWNYLVGR